MALIKCGECKNKVSKHAKMCPNCGAPIRKSIGCGGVLLIIFIVFVVIIGSSTMNTVNRAKERASKNLAKTTINDGVKTNAEDAGKTSRLTKEKVSIDRRKINDFTKWVVANTRAYSANFNGDMAIIIRMKHYESDPQAIADHYAFACRNQVGEGLIIRVKMIDGKVYRSGS